MCPPPCDDEKDAGAEAFRINEVGILLFEDDDEDDELCDDDDVDDRDVALGFELPTITLPPPPVAPAAAWEPGGGRYFV